MAEQTSLLFQTVLGKIGEIVLDASISEQHSSTSEVPEHPVEKGAAFTDHVREKPDQLTIEGLISNHPLTETQAARGKDAVGGETPTYRPGYEKEVDGRIREMKRSAQVLTVVTGLRTYEDMVIESYNVPRDSRSGEALRFTMVLRRVVVVQSKVTVLVVAREPKANGKVRSGKKATKATPDPTAKKSIAYGLVEKLGLLDDLGIN